MRKKINITQIQILILTLFFLVCAVAFDVIELHVLPAEFVGALLGVVITAIITVLLLQGQTKNEESLEKNMKVFEKKQEVYFNFLEKLNTILQKEELQRQQHAEKDIELEEINLQDLIFEFGYLKMHTSKQTFNSILDYVLVLIKENNQLNFKEERLAEDYKNYFKKLSRDYFAIVSLLKQELYAQDPEAINNETMDEIIGGALKGY